MTEKQWTKTQWAHAIGFFLMRLANIEITLGQLRGLLTIIERAGPNSAGESMPDVSRSWYDNTLEQQIGKLNGQLRRAAQKMPGGPKQVAEIEALLGRLMAIKCTRNALAHGTFALKEGCYPETPNYCIVSRAQAGRDGTVSQPAKVLGSDNMALQVSEVAQLELGLSTHVQQLQQRRGVSPPPSTYELTLDSRCCETLLALHFGRFIVYMGEIENLVHTVFQVVVDPVYSEDCRSPRLKLAGYWDSLTLAERLSDLGRLPNTREYEHLKGVLGEIKQSGLIERRNLLCHAKACYRLSPTSERLDLAAVRRTRKGAEVLSVKAVMESIQTASHFSNALSEALAITEVALMKPVEVPCVQRLGIDG